MFSKFGTKIALRKVGLGDLSKSIPDPFATSNNTSTSSKNNDQEGNNAGGFANPFANVQWGAPKFMSSWQTPPAPPIPVLDEPPKVGDRAHSSPKMRFPPVDGRPVVVLFLRYCGCPFTEKLFLSMRSLSNRHPSIHFIAISHCTPEATTAWVKKLGGAWNVDIIVDTDRELYAAWGLGLSNWGHLLHPRNGYNQYLLGKKEGVWGQAVGEGGCRWQVGGAYAVDDRGIVKWGGPMKSVDEQIVFEDGVKALGPDGLRPRGF